MRFDDMPLLQMLYACRFQDVPPYILGLSGYNGYRVRRSLTTYIFYQLISSQRLYLRVSSSSGCSIRVLARHLGIGETAILFHYIPLFSEIIFCISSGMWIALMAGKVYL